MPVTLILPCQVSRQASISSSIISHFHQCHADSPQTLILSALNDAEFGRECLTMTPISAHRRSNVHVYNIPLAGGRSSPVLCAVVCLGELGATHVITGQDGDEKARQHFLANGTFGRTSKQTRRLSSRDVA